MMELKIICGICRKPLHIMDKKLNKHSIVLSVHICGYCESMTRTLQDKLIDGVKMKKIIQ